ncbi:hypothetical protein SCATT_p10740 (plasmid) [Streptantibioticus cattleyicolor NRRL 8057 = DSM 46488]|uniref:Uncharacterized protein n=1 Tax=Streptantibioticus cattleyicolor (strain ATCC 35852 / DSM 46488 / JCM 4925 / NBRC 14057 / NRRL 8057) TaxID=1003195 RepID=G8XEB2_STREN|nr:hypothetical protein SCATT_p10740 [Streptantibioticus cattleyicolor NRRL 8057 = DSM 46488]
MSVGGLAQPTGDLLVHRFLLPATRSPTARAPSILSSSAIPFEVWLFTVPTEMPSATAVSFSDRSKACRSTTQARLRNGSRASAARTSSTSATSGPSAVCGLRDQNNVIRRRSRTALRIRPRARLATTPRA